MPCPICAAPGQARAAEVDGRTLLMCAACRHVTWESMPTEAELTAFYSGAYTQTHGQSELQASHTAYYRDHAEELAALVKRPVAEMAIADVGCSIPVFLEQAAALGCGQALGVDWSEEARAYGAERGVRVVTPDAFLAEVPDRSLDVLRYSHVLEHLTDPLAVLRAQVAKLKPGGLLYITQPNLPMLRVGEVPAPFDNTYPTHLQFFTPASLIRLVESAGCGVERFFTVADPEQHAGRHGAWFDLQAAFQASHATARRGEPLRGLLNNFPFHFGRNSAMYARAGGPAVPLPPPAHHGTGILDALAGMLGEGALAYAVGDGDAPVALVRAGFPRVVTFSERPIAAAPGIEPTGKAAGAAPGTRLLGYTRVADLPGKLRLMRRRILGKPGTLRQVEVIPLDTHARRHGEVPKLIHITGPALGVLAGAAGLVEHARPALCFPMSDAEIPFVRRLTAGQYDVLRVADWTAALEPRAEPTETAENVLGVPKP